MCLVDNLDETQQAQLLAFAAQLPTTCQQVSLAQQLSPELQAFWQKLPQPYVCPVQYVGTSAKFNGSLKQVWPVPSHLKQALLAELCETLHPGVPERWFGWIGPILPNSWHANCVCAVLSLSQLSKGLPRCPTR